MRIASVASALPSHYHSQSEIADALKAQWAGKISNPQVLDRLYTRVGVHNPQVLDRLYTRVGVQGRALSLSLENYEQQYSWGKANSTWLRVAQDLGEAAICQAVAAAGLSKDQLGAFFFVSVTGIASPSVDARLVNRMGLSANIRRIPIFGLGCVGGAAGIARAADYVKAHPDQAAVVLSVELCSLTWQRADVSPANVISSMLFGDGAAAVIVCGQDMNCPGPEIIATRSVFYPHTEEVMGWDISENGFRIVLSPDVPRIILEHLRKDVDDFLRTQGLCRCDIKTWIMHAGGPKVLEAIEQALNLPKRALDVSWKCLQNVGNLSSASVLLVLEKIMKSKRPEPGSYALLAAMGPGFCSELVLMRW